MTFVTRFSFRCEVASARDGIGVADMNAIADLRKEVLRLTKIQHRSVCLRIPQLAAYYQLPERRIREELANLAERKLIQVSSWDGHQLREISSWANPEEFINSTADAGQIHAAEYFE